MRKFCLHLFLILLVFLFCAKTVLAAEYKISLSNLPSYENTTNFRLYYTFIATDGSLPEVNLYVQKDGQGWCQTTDRNKTKVSDVFQLAGSDLYDNEGKYNFYASVAVSGQTINSTVVSTTLDMSPPSAPTEYSKERINPTTYRLTWKNPFDNDFEKVFVYRSKETSFTADSGTKIAEVGGAKDEKMIFNDGSVESGVEYFYALRAVDHAGNISGTVTDAPGTIVLQSITKAPIEGSITKQEVKILPKEKNRGGEAIEEGRVNGGVSSAAGEVKGESQFVVSKYKNWLLTGGVGVILIAAYFFSKKRGK